MHASTINTDRSRAQQRGRRALRSAPRWARVAVAAAISTLGLGVAAGTAAAAPIEGSANYNFTTLDNEHDVTFNQLLGINDSGKIAGYFGSGEEGHPNKGYQLSPPYAQANYENENFPESAQTQVTGLNNSGTTVGFYVEGKGNQIGWYAINGAGFTKVEHADSRSKPKVNQLLGVNESNIAVGFYVDDEAKTGGKTKGYEYDIATKKFKSITVAGDTEVTAAAINNEDEVAGFAKNSGGTFEGFLERPNGTLVRLKFPGATETTVLGLNNGDEAVGNYKNSSGTHGFAWTPGFGFETVNDPNGENNTTINGLNDHGELVGFYEDASKNTDGLLATPKEG